MTPPTPPTVRSRLLSLDVLQRRRDTASGTSLAPLLDGLARELDPLRTRPLPIPAQKARLTRAGGRCPHHGIPLVFDPWSPHAHRCERCGGVFHGAEHDDWWAMGAQLYTVERAVHAAALFALRGDPRDAALAAQILDALSERYAGWPNRDNVLGPSRPFFSTYLESIWLLNACHALDLLETAGAPGVHAVGARLRDRVIAPSAALIASFDEGLSNRQVWNEVAILSALRLLDDARAFEQRVDAEQRLHRLVGEGLLPDGTWYEGENYHLFAHRGLWYGVQLLQASGRQLPRALDARFTAGFVTPFLGVLPDDTLPSRRDAKYGVSVRQWRFAEWCEVGLAHRYDPRLAALLTKLYDGTLARRAEARVWSTADAERDDGPSALSRADLSWRALLMAAPDPVAGAAWHPASVSLPSQGLAVLRREHGRVYVALEGGHTGAGHGHPDRLALTLQTGAERWLQDPGTGSYVERTLHWYRSTLAHHAPLVNGASQPPSPAQLQAFEDRGGMGWMRKTAHIGGAVQATRTVVVCEGYLVDVLDWQSPDDASAPVTITLPLCGAATQTVPHAFTSAVRRGAGGLEDGFDFLAAVEAVALEPDAEGAPRTAALDAVAVSARGDDVPSAPARLDLATNVPATLLRMRVPGAPGCPDVSRHAIELHGACGRLVSVWRWHPTGTVAAVRTVRLDPTGGAVPVAHVTTDDGTTAVHGAAPHGWHIELLARHARSSVDLEGLVVPHDKEETPSPPPAAALTPPLEVTTPWSCTLGAAHYLRTELAWEEAGSPTAVVTITADADHVVVEVEAHTGSVVGPDGPDNPLDNERADTNADGVQWYWAAPSAGWSQAGLFVPQDGAGRTTRLLPGHWPLPLTEHRKLGPGRGWHARFVWRRDDLPCTANGTVAFDLVVNERPPERARRRGQLVLSGRSHDAPAAAAYAYLRGDRQNPARAIRLHLPAR